jgi:2-polyprenyl-3-methyl-5-hydroxy-6-metoxy-1,4-benzoquinol methylase
LRDIGCGVETILEKVSNQNGKAVQQRFSRPAVEHARKMSYVVHHVLLNSAAFPHEDFDIVTAREIVEHLPDPNAELSAIFRLLQPGGYFLGNDALR